MGLFGNKPTVGHLTITVIRVAGLDGEDGLFGKNDLYLKIRVCALVVKQVFLCIG